MDNTNIKCRFCFGEIQELYCFEDFPEAPRAVNIIRQETIRFAVGICKICGLIQLNCKPSPSLLYEEFKNDVVGEKLNEQKGDFAKYLLERIDERFDSVLEYGAGNLKTALKVAQVRPRLRLTVNDINFEVKEELPENLQLINGFFESIILPPHSLDCIYSLHAFEHIDDLKGHIERCKGLLKRGAYYIMAIPYFERWIRDNNLNSFSQEHPIYPTEGDIKNFFELNCFKMVDVASYKDHSLYFTFEFSGDCQVCNVSTVGGLYSRNKGIVDGFMKYIKFLEHLLIKIVSRNPRVQFVVFGANSSGQLLVKLIERLNCESPIVVDNSLLKQGKYLFGTNLVIQTPKILANANKDTICLVFLGVFDKEVQQQISNINPAVAIISKRDLEA